MHRKPDTIHADPAQRLVVPEPEREKSRCQLLSWLIVAGIATMIFIV